MTKRILCYGDSNTFGYVPGEGRRYSYKIRWPGRLQALLGEEYTVIEEGCSGRTVDGELPGEEWKNGNSFLRCALHTHKPLDTVIIMLGTNDMKYDFHKTAAIIADQLKALVIDTRAFLKEKQGFEPEIILVSPPYILKDVLNGPFSYDFGMDAVNMSHELPAFTKKAARECGCVYLDVSPIAEVSYKDGIHLSAKGHEDIALALYPLLLCSSAEAASDAFICTGD